MVTEQQLQTAHSNVKTWDDFLKYVQEIKPLGLTRYEYIVKDGIAVYYDDERYRIRSAPMYEPLMIVNHSSIPQLRLAIALHQIGQTDFLGFCRQAARAGVDNWVIDTQMMQCIYYDLAGVKMLAEPIQQLNYA